MTALAGLVGRLPHVKLPAVRFLNVLFLAALCALGAGIYLALRTTSTTALGSVRTATASRGVVLSSVSATGAVEPAAEIGVSFEAAGLLTQVAVRVGQHVKAGQILGRIDATDDRSAVQQAQAALATAKANLQQTLQGETPEQRAVDALSVQQSNAQVASARTALAQAQKQLRDDDRTSAQAVAQAGQSTSLAQARQQLHSDLGNERAVVAKLKADKAQLVFDGTTYTDAAEAVAAANNALKVAQAKQQADQQASLTLQLQQTVDNQKLSADKASLSSAQAAGNAAYVATLTDQVSQDQNAVNSDALQLQKLQQQQQADGYEVSQAQSAVSTLTGLQSTINGDQSSLTSYESKIVADRNAIASAKSALSTAVTNAKSSRAATLTKDRQAVQSARQQVASAKLGVKTTVANNAVKQAPPTAATLAQLRAAVLQAQAQLASAKRTLARTTLQAPEAGTVAAVNGVVGGQASAGGTTSTSAATASSSSSSSGGNGGSTGSSSSSSFVTLLGRGMQVAAQFSESDASKIAVGQPATVTVSALPNQELAAHVVSVGMVGSSSSGVVEYAVVFALDRTEPKLMAGMSANVSVTVDERDNVINVPSAAVTGSGSNATVTVVKNGVQTVTPVVAGLKGDTTTEIESGLAAGDQVVTSTGATLFSSGTGGLTSTTPTTGGGRRRFGGGGLGGFGGGFGP